MWTQARQFRCVRCLSGVSAISLPIHTLIGEGERGPEERVRGERHVDRQRVVREHGGARGRGHGPAARLEERAAPAHVQPRGGLVRVRANKPKPKSLSLSLSRTRTRTRTRTLAPTLSLALARTWAAA